MAHIIIVVPCFNEEKRLPQSHFSDFSFPGNTVEFILVNDGSRDGTSAVLHKLVNANPERITALDLEKNSGKAEAVRQGFLMAFRKQADFVGFWDADLATPLWEIPAYISVFDERAAIDMVFGARVKLVGREIERKPLRHYLGRVFATAVSLSLDLAVYDTQCGAKIFRVNEFLWEAFAEPFLSRWIFDVEILARYIQMYTRSGIDIENKLYELPLRKWVDVQGSKVRASDFLYASLDLLDIRKAYMRSLPGRNK